MADEARLKILLEDVPASSTPATSQPLPSPSPAASSRFYRRYPHLHPSQRLFPVQAVGVEAPPIASPFDIPDLSSLNKFYRRYPGKMPGFQPPPIMGSPEYWASLNPSMWYGGSGGHYGPPGSGGGGGSGFGGGFGLPGSPSNPIGPHSPVGGIRGFGRRMLAGLAGRGVSLGGSAIAGGIGAITGSATLGAAAGAAGSSLLAGLGAAGGPAGLIVAGAVVAKEALNKLAASAGKTAEQMAEIFKGTSLGGLFQAGGSFAKAMSPAGTLKTIIEHIGDPIGMMVEQVGKVTKAFRDLLAPIETFSERLRNFSGPLARAYAQREATEIRESVRFASSQGADLAEVIKALTGIHVQLERIFADVLRPILRVVTPILQFIQRILEAVEPFIEFATKALTAIVEYLKLIAEYLLKGPALFLLSKIYDAFVGSAPKKDPGAIENILHFLRPGEMPKFGPPAVH